MVIGKCCCRDKSNLYRGNIVANPYSIQKNTEVSKKFGMVIIGIGQLGVEVTCLLSVRSYCWLYKKYRSNQKISG